VLMQPFVPSKAEEMRKALALGANITELGLKEAEQAGDSGWRKIGEASVLVPRLEVPAQ
jgi:methionyl-tRNA synthetase